MKIIRSAKDLQRQGRKTCLAIGFFDGVHLGHQHIIRQTIADARQHEALALAVTFDCHPFAIVAPDRVPPLIYSLPQKLRAIESLGVEALLLIHFDKAFSEQSGETFINRLVRDLGKIQSICVGGNFTFGHQRGGNVALLKKMGDELEFTVHGMAAVSLDGQTVSSTRIRETIHGGDLDGASQMLGRTYSLAGKVIRGDQLGRKLGFPTANLDAPGLVLPPPGVYTAHARVSGQSYQAAVNIGTRPTLKNIAPQVRVEAYLIGFNGDIYDQELELAFVEKLRGEKAFPSLDALEAQIERDVAEVRSRFKSSQA